MNLGPPPPMTFEELLTYLSSCFAGFSLEKRQEWLPTPWRCRIMPNKTTRQDFRCECYGKTPLEALQMAWDYLKEV